MDGQSVLAALEQITALERRSSEDEHAAAISPMIARGLQVLLLTGQRPGEVFRMRWADVGLDAKVGGPCPSRRPRTVSRIVSRSPTGSWSC
jgi:integrase